ncbi:hypothetical protein DFA_06687 [Cavenderia fasciculata]|uniref:Leucine-rich repeat-containing protein n=1 Tax=Cavenderia fasciculata TaxID=261658 RepID=F4Q201_CACFS|nr:uncharacterized protein DFA_06687 [Cavenderia fasciculata]EGG18021.1 hypothetical protein DFA_06687 [Cavenderia fasciculata]|eukprot:XP_004356914.1 hypothetical protein DFA_06687 [Cavenderia fasciculata]
MNIAKDENDDEGVVIQQPSSLDSGDGGVCVLSKYIQAMIIDLLVHGQYDIKHVELYHGFQWVTHQQVSHLMFNKRPKESTSRSSAGSSSSSSFNTLGNIALVSKWWMQVTKQIASSSVHIVGPMKESSFSANDSSSGGSVEYLYWNVVVEKWGNRPPLNFKEFDYSRLPLLLPHLKTIDIVGKNINMQASQAIIQVINAFPHIQVNLKLIISGENDFEWPDNVSFKGLKPNTIVSHTSYEYYDDTKDFHQMLDDLQPNHVNLGFDEGGHDGGVIHFDHPPLFQHLTTAQHINIAYDFVELSHLKEYVGGGGGCGDGDDSFNIQSLKVGIITCPIEKEQPVHDVASKYNVGGRGRESSWADRYHGCGFCGCGDLDIRDTLEDWNELCSNLGTNSTMKKLWLEGPHGEHPMFNKSNKERKESEKKWRADQRKSGSKSGELEEEEEEEVIVSLERLSSRFVPIWETNKSIKLLGLSKLPKIISPQFFNTLCHNQHITTLILTDGTLVKEYIPSFSQLLITNHTIKALDISQNYLEHSAELDKAFKQNQLIKVLNIAENEFTSDIFDSFLESDTIEYLIIDETLAKNHHQHRYFNQSKSLIKRFCVGAFDDKPLRFYFKPSLLLED